MAGVIGHIANPTETDAVGLATAAEAAGADWIGLADAFWWRDVWLLLDAIAGRTHRITIGPAMTNPYTRHMFQTASALATLQERAPGRVMCGIAAGGSELTAAAGISRSDAPTRVRELVALIRRVAADQMLDAQSGCRLEVSLEAVPVLIAGRGDAMLRTAGALADRVLLWAIPRSDLDRSVNLIREGAAPRDRAPELVWAPLVAHADAPESSLIHVAVYASLNTARDVRLTWGLDDARVDQIRARLVAGDLPAATELVPQPALDDLVFDGPDPEPIIELARRHGVGSLAVPGFAVGTVAGHVEWAAGVEGLC